MDVDRRKTILLAIGFVALASLAFLGYRALRDTEAPSSSTGPAASAPMVQTAETAPAADIPAPSLRGPGMRRQPLEALRLPVPRTFDLAHVAPAHFVAALGRDPARLFEFVRDQVTFEAYEGCLRGARGTLIAMAGNSVDRAALLADLLRQAGQRVRFAQGTLSEALARELVSSMWADRPEPPVSDSVAALSPEQRKAISIFPEAVNRDLPLVLEHLAKARVASPPAPAVPLQVLVAETRMHYWVQWDNSGNWVDLDPSFADASPGKASASVEQTFAVLPASVFHRLAARVRVEEYTGREVSTRTILTFEARTADLAAADLVLSHWPEDWNGPAADLQSGISSALTNTGRVKPVLFTGTDTHVEGQPFQLRPATGGAGGIGALLRGEGTRRAVTLATAEYLDFEFIAPGGQSTTVSRELFDVIGPARRENGPPLQEAEIQNLVKGERATDVTKGVFSCFVTTGLFDPAHLLGLGPEPTPDPGEDQSIDIVLRNLSTMFVAISDALLAKLGSEGDALMLFYPHSPRVVIAEFSSYRGRPRMALDLRRTELRMAALGPRVDAAPVARLLRGIVEGTLERALLDLLPAEPDGTSVWAAALGTSTLIERARAEGATLVVLPAETGRLASNIPPDALARLRQDLAQGFVAIAPERAVPVDGVPRFGWWRIDPRTGTALAVTDEGTFGQTVEYKAVGRRNADGSTTIRLYVRGGAYGPRTQTFGPFAQGSKELGEITKLYLNNGIRIAWRGPSAQFPPWGTVFR